MIQVFCPYWICIDLVDDEESYLSENILVSALRGAWGAELWEYLAFMRGERKKEAG